VLEQAGPGRFRRLRYRLRRLYHSTPVQSAVAVLIFFSFIVNIIQTELVGQVGADAGTEFQVCIVI
jgi:hypothetical protein